MFYQKLRLCLGLPVTAFTQKRTPNLPRMIKAWNSIVPTVKSYNTAMEKVNGLLKELMNPHLISAIPDTKRLERVGLYKAAREAILQEVDALNVLIEEEDY